MGANYNYPELFVALGKYIADQKLDRVCVLEFEEGFIISGSTIYEGSDGFRRTLQTRVLSDQDLKALIAQSAPPKGTPPRR